MSPFRGFIAIDIPSLPAIENVLDTLKKTGANLKLVEPENLHITLKFLGDTPDTQIQEIHTVLETCIQDIHPFTIQLQRLGVFPNNNYMKVIWIGIQDDNQLLLLSKSINQLLKPLGFKTEKRPFQPHFTLARVRSAKNKAAVHKFILDHADDDFGTFTVNTIDLKKSQLTPSGPIYTTVTSVTLKDRK
jgi:2'-5' RNA ligase